MAALGDWAACKFSFRVTSREPRASLNARVLACDSQLATCRASANCRTIATITLRLLHVQEYQNAFQLRSACNGGRGPSGLASVRQKDQRVYQPVEGE